MRPERDACPSQTGDSTSTPDLKEEFIDHMARKFRQLHDQAPMKRLDRNPQSGNVVANAVT